MATSKVEKYSIDWKAIRRRYEGQPCSIRALAREHATSDTAIHRRAKLDGWKLFSSPIPRATEVQQSSKKPMLWDFEPRRDALIAGLRRSRNGVAGVEDAIYADLPVVMALLWLRAPFADIAAALQIDEAMLERLYGKPILAFVRQYHWLKSNRSERRSGT